MSNYTKATDFAAKDALLSGDPAKIIKGTEIDTEYNAISTAISTKADTVSPTFTGTPLAPTATPGTNTTQVATTAFVTAADVAERTATATLTNKTLTSPVITGANATITSGTITGITDLTVADGGTGVSALTADNVILGDGTNPVKFVAPSTTGNVLTSNGTTWTSAAPKLDQVVTSSTSAVTSVGGTAIPLDNTIPQNTEGTEILTATITPKSASSTLIITCSIGQVSPNDGRTFIVAFFQDSVADAFHTSVFVVNAGQNGGGTFTFAKTSGTTSATTFKVRLGPNVSATAYINGTSGGTQLFNGSCNATLMVTEIAV